MIQPRRSDHPSQMPGDGDGKGLTLALSVEDERWERALAREPEVFIAETLDLAARHLGDMPAFSTEVSVTLSDDATVRGINREWRDKDKPTNVLSFPMLDLEPGDPPGPLLGDLILAFETCEREARAEDKSFADHARHLLVHGFLHCLGHDHIEDDEAEVMESLEKTILAGFNIRDPYDIADDNPSRDR